MEPSTASSACKLCGGRLRSRSSLRVSAARDSRSFSRRSMAIVSSDGPQAGRGSGAADGAHLDGHCGVDCAMQPRRHLVRTDLTYRVADVEVTAVDARADLLLNRIGD